MGQARPLPAEVGRVRLRAVQMPSSAKPKFRGREWLAAAGWIAVPPAYLARLNVTWISPPAMAAGLLYFSSSAVTELIVRLCGRPS